MTYYGKLPVEQWVKVIGWFGDKVCVCASDNGVYHIGYDWERFAEYKQPPICRWCDKWQNRIHKCPKCHEYFYEFFNHPRTGYHHEPVRGWYCWNCLEKYRPPAVESCVIRHLPKTPPPALVLPPGYVLREQRKLF
jgi:hypothetical protein